jgi:exoribonuclease II
MNERIKQLAEQASLYARSDNSSMLFENYQKRYTEKFADLIVRECMEVANIGSADLIKEHFGVE